MSYFKARVGQSPEQGTKTEPQKHSDLGQSGILPPSVKASAGKNRTKAEPPAQAPTPLSPKNECTPKQGIRIKSQVPKPYFAAQLGSRPPVINKQRPGANTLGPSTSQSKIQNPKSTPALRAGASEIQNPKSFCPLCHGELTKQGGLYHCQGRCGARWLEESPNRLIDLAALPFGVCTCCPQPQPLGRSDRGAVCPITGREYLLLPDGPVPLAEAAPDGLCHCCRPPMPLIWQDEALVCQRKVLPPVRTPRGSTHLACPHGQDNHTCRNPGGNRRSPTPQQCPPDRARFV